MIVTGTKQFNPDALGHVAKVDEDRSVMVLRDNGSVLLGFKNGDKRTRVCVTDEAAWALFCALGSALDAPIPQVLQDTVGELIA